MGKAMVFDASPELYEKPTFKPATQTAGTMTYDHSGPYGGPEPVSWELRRVDGSLVLDSRSGYPSAEAVVLSGMIDRRFLSLRNLDFTGASMPVGAWDGSDFRGAKLDRAKFRDSTMHGAIFDDVEGKPSFTCVDARGASGLGVLRERGSFMHATRGAGGASEYNSAAAAEDELEGESDSALQPGDTVTIIPAAEAEAGDDESA